MDGRSRWRRFIDWVDRATGLVLARFLAVLCVLGGGAALVSAVLTMRRAFAWSLLFPLLGGLFFLGAGFWLWRSKKRLSDFDLTS